MLFFASRPDPVFTAILHDALEDLQRILTDSETDPAEAEEIWKVDYPTAAKCFPLALAVDTLDRLLAASKDPMTIYRITDYHWLLLYACLNTYCGVHNDYAEEAGSKVFPVGLYEIGEIDFAAIVDHYFWDTDFLLDASTGAALGPGGGRAWGSARKRLDSQQLVPHFEKLRYEVLPQTEWGSEALMKAPEGPRLPTYPPNDEDEGIVPSGHHRDARVEARLLATRTEVLGRLRKTATKAQGARQGSSWRVFPLLPRRYRSWLTLLTPSDTLPPAISPTLLLQSRRYADPLPDRVLMRKPYRRSSAGQEEYSMPEKTTWERFFDAHAPIYDDNVFTKNTVHEVDFLLDELLIPPGGAVLDVGCGTGRHAIELAKRGYLVTGLDLSSEMLSRAADKAKAENVQVEWVRSNATQFTFPGRYDAAVCLGEGAFGLLGQSNDPIDQPMSILRNISRSLKPQAKAVFTVLNGASMLRKHQNKDVAEGRFDPLTMVESSEHSPQEGLPVVAVRERAFVPTELLLLFRIAGMSVLNMWGGTAGNWGRRSLDLDEIEIMIVACKTAEPLAAGDAGKPRA